MLWMLLWDIDNCNANLNSWKSKQKGTFNFTNLTWDMDWRVQEEVLTIQIDNYPQEVL